MNQFLFYNINYRKYFYLYIITKLTVYNFYENDNILLYLLVNYQFDFMNLLLFPSLHN